MATFPGAKKTFTQMADGVDDMEAVNANVVYDEVEAVESELGVSDTPVATSVRGRLNTLESGIAEYIKLVDSKAANTNGGTFTSGDWRKRTVTEETDVGDHCVVAASVIVLDEGDYEVHISCPAYRVNQHKARLRNTTAGTTLLMGTSEIIVNTDIAQTRSIIVGLISVGAAQNLEIQHYCLTTRNANGLGVASNFGGENEIYTVAEFRKV